MELHQLFRWLLLAILLIESRVLACDPDKNDCPEGFMCNEKNLYCEAIDIQPCRTDADCYPYTHCGISHFCVEGNTNYNANKCWPGKRCPPGLKCTEFFG